MADAWRRFWYELRCYWAEVLFGWAIKIAPDDYVPSWVEVAVNQRRKIAELVRANERLRTMGRKA
jgi:hypothetical protein